MGTNLIRKSYGYRCTPLMRLLGLLRYDITSLFYHVIVEALESLLWFWYIYGIMCLTSFVCFYILRLNEYIWIHVRIYKLLFFNHWFFNISSWLYGLDFVLAKVFGLELFFFWAFGLDLILFEIIVFWLKILKWCWITLNCSSSTM